MIQELNLKAHYISPDVTSLVLLYLELKYHLPALKMQHL